MRTVCLQTDPHLCHYREEQAIATWPPGLCLAHQPSIIPQRRSNGARSLSGLIWSGCACRHGGFFTRLFLALARRGARTYNRSRQRSKQWTIIQAHYKYVTNAVGLSMNNLRVPFKLGRNDSVTFPCILVTVASC